MNGPPLSGNNFSSHIGLGPSVQHSLSDILRRRLRRSPIPRNKSIASSTTDRPAKMFINTHKNGDEVIGIVYAPTLINQTVIRTQAMTESIYLFETKTVDTAFMAFSSPNLTSSFCSPELFSEYDTRSYVDNVLIRPALAAMHILANGGELPESFTWEDCSTDSYVTSGFKIAKKAGPIADCLLIQGPYTPPKSRATTDEDDDEEVLVEVHNEEKERSTRSSHATISEKDCPKVLMTIEIKSGNALTRQTFKDITRLKTAAGYKTSKGILMRFFRPGEGTQKIKKTTKIVAQVFEQMEYHEIEYSLLSSHDTNFFFYMKRGSRILYMSDQYDLRKITPLHVLAWFCRARGLIDEELILPEVDESYLDVSDPKYPNETGLRAQAVFEALNKANPKRVLSDEECDVVDVEHKTNETDETQVTPKAKPKVDQRMRKRSRRG